MLRIVERLVARGGPSTLAAQFRRGSRLILAYHNVVPDDAVTHGERSLHLPLSRFREQLDALQRTHEIVSLTELIAGSARSARPLAAITSDDAYRGWLQIALPELERRQLPSTVFVAPGILGGNGCWWDLLADAMTGRLPVPVREHILSQLAGDGSAALQWARDRGVTAQSLPDTHCISTEVELQEAARYAGVVLAPHSWSHRNFAALGVEDLTEELARPLHWLRERFTNVMPWLAYPYGLYGQDAARVAQDTGYAGVLRISGGWASSADVSTGDLPRLNVPAGMSTDRFMLKTRGVLPL